MKYTVNQNSDIYYKNTYWNDLYQVNEFINNRISNDKGKNCYKYFQELTKNRTFNKALILNCGNGGVERQLINIGLINEAVGIDYSEKLIAEAKSKAAELPLRYYVMDTNTALFPETGYDLVVNHAAAHHIAYINKVFIKLAELLPNDGYFISMDYVGPHRNQYPLEQWNAACELNQRLPNSLRQNMRYPHLPTMLVTDPTEAIHSELIIETMNRYFHIDQHHKIGGALAYLLLTFNDNFFKSSEKDTEKWIHFILEEDGKYLLKNPLASMFDFIIARPNKEILKDKRTLQSFQDAENIREEHALKNNGQYYKSRMTHSSDQQLLLRLKKIIKKYLPFKGRDGTMGR
jgi:SAM-dependent methyltransferase